MNLLEMIDDAVDFVAKHRVMSRPEIDELRQKADAIFRAVYPMGLDRALPKQGQLGVEFPDLEPASYETKLNVPGDWYKIGPLDEEGMELPEPLQSTFVLCQCPRWLEDMADFRALVADRREDKGKAERNAHWYEDYVDGYEHKQWRSVPEFQKARHISLSRVQLWKILRNEARKRGKSLDSLD